MKRRSFLTGVLTAAPAIGLAGALAPGESVAAQVPGGAGQKSESPQKNSIPDRSLEAAETTTPDVPRLTVSNPGSDFMVDVIKSLNFEYVAAVPGSSFRGFQESWVNYGGNKPEWITCLHEDSSVGIADGYAKMSGKPLLVMIHGVVGLQHAPMAIYNAFCDEAPIVMIAGNQLSHSAHDQAIIVRDITKWDDQPSNMQGFAESMVRAYDVATSPPMAPVLIVANGELMENELPPNERRKLRVPTLKERTAPVGEIGAVREAAKWLVAAENPVIVADRYCRTQAGMDMLVMLAETLQAPVLDRGSRLNFPNRHPLCHTLGGGPAVRQADVLLVLEATDLFREMYGDPDVADPRVTSKLKPGAKVISLGIGATGITKSNFYPNMFQSGYSTADLEIRGDGEATLPSLIEAIQQEMNGANKTRAMARGQKLVETGPHLLENARRAAAAGWEASPITTPRLSMEVWDQLKNEPDWAAGALSAGLSAWPWRLWDFKKRYQHIGGQGGGGLGYSAPAAVGAALANKAANRLTVGIVGDGDYNMQPAVIWTAVRHKLPLLMIVHNNGGYYQEIMHLQRMAGQRSRGIENGGFGCTFDPLPNYAKVAQGYGCYAEGPISDPKDLAAAIKRAIAVVKKGEPAFLDVMMQAR
jgi:thiamine pyrophosphate-dependent acetolactate synthase large subunit-like protein